MEKEELKSTIDAIIKECFKRVSQAYKNQEINCRSEHDGSITRLVFPKYNKNKGTRISEQELRFAFVEEFNDYCKKHSLQLFYSVETPTEDDYTFSQTEDNGKRSNKCEAGKGQSAAFDLVIHDENLKRVALIEFKSLNADEHAHKKDFCKLNNIIEGDENVLRYFIELIKSYSETGNNSTISSLTSKNTMQEGNLIAYFWCYALEGKSRGKGVAEDITDKISKRK